MFGDFIVIHVILYTCKTFECDSLPDFPATVTFFQVRSLLVYRPLLAPFSFGSLSALGDVIVIHTIRLCG